MAGRLLTAKFPQGLKYYLARFVDDDVSLYYDRHIWWIRGFGVVAGSAGLPRSMRLLLDSGSEITYLDRTWKYDEFGKLAVEIEKVKLEKTLEALEDMLEAL